MRCLLLVPLALLGCKKPSPAANPEFDDAAVFVFLELDGDEADLAYAVRQLERQVYLGMDVESDNVQDRALTLRRLTEEEVAHLEHPDRPVADAVPIAVAGVSAHPLDQHQRVQLLADQRPVEPYSPNKYERTFLEETETCWRDQGCPWLHTWNDLVKENFLMTVPYEFLKDFRWVDLHLPDPASVPEGEEAVNEGAPRWGLVARSWTTRSYPGEGGNTAIHQSFTVEVWLPRDGGGFVRDGTETNENGGEWTSDSRGDDTTLRMLALWSETELGLEVSDDMVASTTRAGIDDNFQAGDAWLDENPE